MNSSIVCRKCQKLGRAVCACWLAGWAVVVPIKDLGPPPAHAVDAIMSTATTSGSAPLIHRPATPAPLTATSQAATPISSRTPVDLRRTSEQPATLGENSRRSE